MTRPAKHSAKEERPRVQFDIITFDCYGTLIDWETGIYNAFKTAFQNTGQPVPPRPELLKVYREEERRLEKEHYTPYRQILSRAVHSIGQKQGLDTNHLDPNILAASLPSWKPFPDVNPSLERLSRHHKLGILSNIDKNLLSLTMKQFTVGFSLIVTAENVRSYKPRTAHFEAARKVNGQLTWLHVAASLYHDIEPAMSLGIQTAWINRQNEAVASSLRGRTIIVKDLSELAACLGD